MSIIRLFHFDGVNGSTAVIDETGNDTGFTCTGSSILSNTGQVFGSACLALNGSPAFSFSNIYFALSDFTIRFRYLVDVNDLNYSFQRILTAGSVTVFIDTGLLKVNIDFEDSSSITLNLGAVLQDVNYAISIERFGNSFYGYVDGALIDSTLSSQSVASSGIFLSDFGGTGVVYGKIDELLVDNGASYGQGSSSYIVENSQYFLTPSVPDFELINYGLSGFDAELQNELAPIFAFDAELISSMCSGVDAVLLSVGYSADDVELQSKSIEYSKFDAELKSIGYSITAFDVILVNDVGIMISKADFELINFMSGDVQSVVVDIHNPEQPIYGNY